MGVRVLQMRATAEWQATRAMPKGREGTKAFRDLRVRFRLSEYDLHAERRAKHRKASGRGRLLRHQQMSKARFESLGARWNATSTTAALRGSSVLDADCIRSKGRPIAPASSGKQISSA